MVPEGLAAPVPVLGMESMGGTPQRGPGAARRSGDPHTPSFLDSQPGWLAASLAHATAAQISWLSLPVLVLPTPHQNKLMVIVIVKTVNTVKLD